MVSGLSAVCQRRLGGSVVAVAGLRERRPKSLRTLLIQGMSGNTNNNNNNNNDNDKEYKMNHNNNNNDKSSALRASARSANLRRGTPMASQVESARSCRSS